MRSKVPGRGKPPPPRPDAMFVFDTETRTDATQRLTFGSYRFIVAEQCLKEALFFGDDLPDKDRRVLERYIASHQAETGEEGVRKLDLLTREELVDKLYLDAYKGALPSGCVQFPVRHIADCIRFRECADAVLQGASHSVFGRISIKAVANVRIATALGFPSSKLTASAP